MKKFLMLVFAVVLAVSAVCFAEAPKAAEGTQTVQTQAAAAYKTLTPQQAKQRMGQNDKIVVLDVRHAGRICSRAYSGCSFAAGRFN